jgi:hypothetical protein
LPGAWLNRTRESFFIEHAARNLSLISAVMARWLGDDLTGEGSTRLDDQREIQRSA